MNINIVSVELVCNRDGVVYDLLAIVPFLKKYGVDPANGNKLTIKDLIRLKFHKYAII